MSNRPTRKDLAAALGVTGPHVSTLKGRGMPVHSVAAAAAWRRQNLDSTQVRRAGRHDLASEGKVLQATVRTAKAELAAGRQVDVRDLLDALEATPQARRLLPDEMVLHLILLRDSAELALEMVASAE
jgi:hypothetical protein